MPNYRVVVTRTVQQSAVIELEAEAGLESDAALAEAQSLHGLGVDWQDDSYDDYDVESSELMDEEDIA